MKEIEYGIILVERPDSDPLDFATLKRHIKASKSDDDNTIREMLNTARDMVEDHTGLTMINTTFQMVFDAWPNGKNDEWWDGVREGAIAEFVGVTEIELPRAPLVSVTHIKTYDDAGAATIFAADQYIVDRSRRKPRIGLKTGASWPVPGRRMAGIEIEFICGHGTEPKDVDYTLKLGVMMQVAYLFQNRGDASKLDTEVERLLDRKRIKRL